MNATPKKRRRGDLGDMLTKANSISAAAKYRRPLSLREAESALGTAAARYGILPEVAIAELHSNSALARLARMICGINDDTLDPKWVAFAMVEKIRRKKRMKLDAVYAEARDRIVKERSLGSKTRVFSTATIERYYKLAVAHLKTQSIADLYRDRPKQIRRRTANKRNTPVH